MILLIEPDKTIGKKLCDLLSRERIVSVGSIPETLEMICKFKNNFDIIIANIRLLNDILSKGTLFRLCEKLYIKIPPILTFYRKGDDKIKEKFEKEYTQYKLIEYNKEDTSFPERYIQAVQALYSEISVDIKKANEVWLRGDEPEVSFNPRQWLVQEGFMNAIEGSKFGKIAKDTEEMIALIKKILAAESEKEIKINERKQKEDYESMYFELKKKYDELLKYVKELANSTKK